MRNSFIAVKTTFEGLFPETLIASVSSSVSSYGQIRSYTLQSLMNVETKKIVLFKSALFSNKSIFPKIF